MPLYCKSNKTKKSHLKSFSGTELPSQSINVIHLNIFTYTLNHPHTHDLCSPTTIDSLCYYSMDYMLNCHVECFLCYKRIYFLLKMQFDFQFQNRLTTFIELDVNFECERLTDSFNWSFSRKEWNY